VTSRATAPASKATTAAPITLGFAPPPVRGSVLTPGSEDTPATAVVVVTPVDVVGAIVVEVATDEDGRTAVVVVAASVVVVVG